MPDAARVYAEALFEVAQERGKLAELREQLAQFADAVEAGRELRVFFFSPYFSTKEKVAALKRTLSGAEPELINFLEMIIDKHRMPEIFAIRRRFEELWKRENRRIDVTVTSAVELDPTIVKQIGEEIARQTEHQVDLVSRVQEDILGGVVLQVGNMVLDASVRARLEKLRKSVAGAA